jgi:hypothetical protein
MPETQQPIHDGQSDAMPCACAECRERRAPKGNLSTAFRDLGNAGIDHVLKQARAS